MRSRLIISAPFFLASFLFAQDLSEGEKIRLEIEKIESRLTTYEKAELGKRYAAFKDKIYSYETFRKASLALREKDPSISNRDLQRSLMETLPTRSKVKFDKVTEGIFGRVAKAERLIDRYYSDYSKKREDLKEAKENVLREATDQKLKTLILRFDEVCPSEILELGKKSIRGLESDIYSFYRFVDYMSYNEFLSPLLKNAQEKTAELRESKSLSLTGKLKEFRENCHEVDKLISENVTENFRASLKKKEPNFLMQACSMSLNYLNGLFR